MTILFECIFWGGVVFVDECINLNNVFIVKSFMVMSFARIAYVE